MYNGPCKDCPDRFIGCHDECEKYKSFREELERCKKIMIKEIESRRCSVERSVKLKEFKRKKIRARR